VEVGGCGHLANSGEGLENEGPSGDWGEEGRGVGGVEGGEEVGEVVEFGGCEGAGGVGVGGDEFPSNLLQISRHHLHRPIKT